MKLLTVTIPCYNSQDYMEKCIDSILPGGDRVEIIIIDDGSKDNTGAIADKYAARYPDIIRVVHQPNGGHGEGINQGLRHATGKYFKTVDSDDWLSEDFPRFLDLVNESGRSSWLYLQNVVPTGSTRHQELALSLALAARLLQGRGACRVHGGGFAGTIQAFVPLDLLDAFRSGMEAVLGEGSCQVLSIRPEGGILLEEVEA